MLRYFLNDDIAGDVVPVLRKMLRNKLSMVRRKSIFVLFHIYSLLPHLVSDIKEVIVAGLSDTEVPVMFGALSMLKNLIEEDPTSFKAQTKAIV